MIHLGARTACGHRAPDPPACLPASEHLLEIPAHMQCVRWVYTVEAMDAAYDEIDEYGSLLGRWCLAIFGGSLPPRPDPWWPDTPRGRLELWRLAEFAASRGYSMWLKYEDGHTVQIARLSGAVA